MTFARHAAESSLFLLIVLGPVPLSLFAARAVRAGRTARTPAEPAVVGIVTWCALQTALGLLLGMTGRLAAGPLFASEAILAVVGLALVLWFAPSAGQLSAVRGGTSDARRMSSEACLGGCLACFAVALIWWLGTQPIGDHDSLAYHLPTLATWYQTGSFTMPDQYWFYGRYPYGLEVMCALFLFPFGEDFMVALPNLLAWVLLGLGIYCFAVEIGADRLLSLSSAALVLSLPSVVENVNTIHNDLPLASFAIAAGYLALRYIRTRCRDYLGLSLAAIGLLVGMKTSGLAYTALILVALAVGRLASGPLKRDSGGLRDGCGRFAVPIAIAGTGLALFIGGFWYVRNLVEVGNPLGYMTVSIGGFVIFPGRLPPEHFRRTMIAAIFDPTSAADWRIMLSQIYQQFHVPFLVLAGLTLLALPALAVRRKPVGNALLLQLLGLVAATGFLYTVTPYSGDNGSNQWQMSPFVGQALRYAFPFCAALGLAAAATATAVGIPPGSLAVAAVLCLALHLFGSSMSFLLVGFLAACILLWPVSLSPRQAGPRSMSRPARALAVVVVALVLILAGGFAARRVRDARRPTKYGPVFEFVQNRVPRDTPIGYLMSHRSYLLYGKDLSRRVVYAPLDSRSFDDWVASLRERNLTMVAVGPLGPSEEESRLLQRMNGPDSPFTCVVPIDPTISPVLYQLKQ